jgi:hypothetical protein
LRAPPEHLTDSVGEIAAALLSEAKIVSAMRGALSRDMRRDLNQRFAALLCKHYQ